MLGVRSNFLAADENQVSTIGDLQQRIEILGTLIQKKNTVIQELKHKLEYNNSALDQLATQAEKAEHALQAEEQTHQAALKKIKDRYSRFKEKHKQLAQEQSQKAATEIEKHKDLIQHLQSNALRKELDNIHLTLTIRQLAQLAREELRTLKKQLESSKKLFLQSQQAEMQKLTVKLGKIAKAETAYKNEIQRLSAGLLDKSKKLRILKPATRQLLLDQQRNQELISELQTKMQSEQTRFEIQTAQLTQVTALQQETALALRKKNKETIEAYLENAYLKHQLQELQKEKNQADQRLLSNWKKWLWGGIGSGSATLTGFILGALVFTATLWNPVGLTLLILSTVISGYCFYEARINHRLAETVKRQPTLSTTAQLAFPLGGGVQTSLFHLREKGRGEELDLVDASLESAKSSPSSPAPLLQGGEGGPYSALQNPALEQELSHEAPSYKC